MGHRLQVSKVFHERFDANVFMFSYRGYGKSEGSPTEVGMKQDAQCAVDYLLSRDDIDKRKIVVFGQSIGGAVAIYLTAHNLDSIRALMLENTFRSLPELIPHVIPIAKYFTSLCVDKWQSEDIISSITHIPVLFMSSQRDELIPASHMTMLYDLVGTTKKTYVPIPFAGHNDAIAHTEYWVGMSKFWEQYVTK